MLNEDTILLDSDTDSALIGVGMTWHGDMLVERCIYDGPSLAYILMEDKGMTEDEAIEYIDNYVAEYQGDTTPIVMWPIEIDQEAEQ